MKPLSKSRLISYRQCPRRLWLEVHRPELRLEAASSEAAYAVGHQVGEIARRLMDPSGRGRLFDAQKDGYGPVIAWSLEALNERRPLFEAGYSAGGALAFVDALLPDASGTGWRLVEVKSSSRVKDYQRDDLALQVHVLREAGVTLTSAAVAYVDKEWTYPGGGDYRGLLSEMELLGEALSRDGEIREWIGGAREVAALPEEPLRATGSHCASPFPCPFSHHCAGGETPAMFPVEWLPSVRRRSLRDHVAQEDILDMRQVPDDLLNGMQRRVKTATLSGEPWFDREGAARALAAHPLPLRFLDFETVMRAVPVWAGTRPFQQIPFQFSLHTLDGAERARHEDFLDLSGDDPSRAFAVAVTAACGESGAVVAYNAAFEGQVLQALANRFPELAPSLLALRSRLVDLLPLTVAHYYHPLQRGSWSIKSVLPAVAPDLDHGQLEGVADGQMAVQACIEATDPATPRERSAMLGDQLRAYCRLDTWAMVRLWTYLAGWSSVPVDAAPDAPEMGLPEA